MFCRHVLQVCCFTKKQIVLNLLRVTKVFLRVSKYEWVVKENAFVFFEHGDRSSVDFLVVQSSIFLGVGMVVHSIEE